MTEQSIQQSLMFDLHSKGVTIQCTNYWLGHGECDLIAITSAGMAVEYEIKISKSDFKADAKKTRKHAAYAAGENKSYASGWSIWGIPNRFYYVCPQGLLEAKDIPVYAGLIWVGPLGSIDVKVRAPLIHNQKHGEKLIYKIAQALTARLVFGGSFNKWRDKQSADQDVPGVGGEVFELALKEEYREAADKLKNLGLTNEAKEFFENNK